MKPAIPKKLNMMVMGMNPMMNMEDMGSDGDCMATAAELFARCKEANVKTHMAHLLTSSYAAHMALGGFYDKIDDLADSFAESFIARCGKFEEFPMVSEPSTDGLKVVCNLRDWIDSNRASISNESEIQNIIDEIIAVCNAAIYKLKELK